jgi:hypothetical protein
MLRVRQRRRLQPILRHLRPTRVGAAAAEAEAGDEARRPREAPVDPLFRAAPPLAPAGAKDLTPEAIVRALKKDGCVLIPGAIPRELARSLAAELATCVLAIGRKVIKCQSFVLISALNDSTADG